MTEEFNLSDEIEELEGIDIIRYSYVKEFIRLLKEDLSAGDDIFLVTKESIREEIDKLAGDKLK